MDDEDGAQLRSGGRGRVKAQHAGRWEVDEHGHGLGLGLGLGGQGGACQVDEGPRAGEGADGDMGCQCAEGTAAAVGGAGVFGSFRPVGGLVATD